MTCFGKTINRMDVKGKISWDVASSGQIKNLEPFFGPYHTHASNRFVTIKPHCACSVTEAIVDHRQRLALQKPRRAPVRCGGVFNTDGRGESIQVLSQ